MIEQNVRSSRTCAIAGKFEALTQKRYENARLTAHLGTEGIIVGGAGRATERLSIGTREQHFTRRSSSA